MMGIWGLFWSFLSHLGVLHYLTLTNKKVLFWSKPTNLFILICLVHVYLFNLIQLFRTNHAKLFIFLRFALLRFDSYHLFLRSFNSFQDDLIWTWIKSHKALFVQAYFLGLSRKLDNHRVYNLCAFTSQ